MNKFAKLQGKELEDHLSTFLVDSWSPSSVNDFIRNEKSFEKKHIFKDYPKWSRLSAIIGKVYHHALMRFFEKFKEDKTMLGFDALCDIAHKELHRYGADRYLPQKKLTIGEQQLEALKAINYLIQNFLSEFDSYKNEIQEIVLVETKLKEFVSLNDIEIPLPLVVRPDIVFIDKNGDLAILDHKSVKAYTASVDVNIKFGNQGISYKKAVDAWILKQPEILRKFPKASSGVQKFLFYENKYTKNKDGSRQIKQIPIDIKNGYLLYEQILFEGIWRVIEAVKNPDYVYLMNPSDHFEEGDDLVNFWVKTHIEGLEGFPNLTPSQKRLLERKRKDIRKSSLVQVPKNIIKSFTSQKSFISLSPEDMEKMTIPERIQHRLATFNYPVRVAHVIEGYSCDTYLLEVNAGLKISKIYGYSMDIANSIGVPSIRISSNLVSYKNGAYVAIEVNRDKTTPLILDSAEIPSGNVFPIGKNNFGEIMSWDIDNPSTPHLMIAGSTGSGKSVAIRTIIDTAIKKKIKVTILDPKYDEKFLSYKETRNVKVLNELPEIEKFMKEKVKEMDDIFRKYGATGASAKKQLIIFDEAADCFARQSKELEEPEDIDEFDDNQLAEFKKEARKFKTLEENTLILAQKARSAGIHIVLAAQRFSVKVLNGDAKANFSTRLCLFVKSMIDSRVMIDQDGAEKLKGKGDALFTSPEFPEPVRTQCFITA